MRLQRHNAEHGFTLIELMVVVVVLGILLGLVLLAVSPFTAMSIAATCRSELDSLRTANVAYRTSHGTDAASVATLTAAGLVNRAPKYVTLTNGVTNPATDSGCNAATDSSSTTSSSSTSSSTTTPTTSTTTSTTTPTTTTSTSTTTLIRVGISKLTGTIATVGSNYQTELIVTISPALTGVTVSGTWTDGKTQNASCTTVAGTCTAGPTTHTNGTSATWKANAVSTLPGGYQAGTNGKTQAACTKGDLLCTAS